MTPATRGAERPVATRRPDRPRSTMARTYRRRRIAAAIGALLLLVGLGVAGRVLLHDVGLADVEDVQVTGTSTLSVAEVVDAAAVVPGAPLAAVDTEGIAERVRRVPAVESAQVEVDWPHTVVIAVTERVPLAVVQTPQGLQLVDRTGTVYRGSPPAELPRLTVGEPGPTDAATLAAVAVLTALPDAVRSQVRRVDAAVTPSAAAGQVDLGLTEDRQVRWGGPERGRDKATVLVPLLTQPGTVYDVTSPELPTIRR